MSYTDGGVSSFSQRICPGMHLAPTTAILATMKLLWAFEFRPAVDPATGTEIPLDVHAHPDEHARFWNGGVRPAGARDLAREEGEEMVPAALVVEAQAAHPAVEAGELPPGGPEELREEDLGEPGRVLGREVDEVHEGRDEEGRGRDVPEAEAWREDFGEAARGGEG